MEKWLGTGVITKTDGKEFTDAVFAAIEDHENDGFTTEVKFSTTMSNGYVVYSALVVGRKTKGER